MRSPSIQLDDCPPVRVLDVAVPTPSGREPLELISLSAWQPMRSLDVSQVLPFQRRSDTLIDVGEHIEQQFPIPLASPLPQRGTKSRHSGEPALRSP